MSKFQLIVLGFFIIFIIVGVAVFATFKGSSGGSSQLAAITVWGTFPAETFNNYVAKINLESSLQLKIAYVQKDKGSFSREFIAALARGQGPDALLIPADMLMPHLDKLAVIPFTALLQRTFTDTYIQESEIYLGQNGVFALPFALDPMVMYWNRDIFSSAGLAMPPKTWGEFTNLNQKITTKDQNGNIRKSAIAMGDFSNILNARELLGSLFLQFDNTITQISGSAVQSTLKQSPNLAPALDFFTQFVNPNDKNYSWNRGMTDSKTAFLSGTLATYFGFASELSDIRAKNPNLNFDVAALPQLKSGGTKAVYGKMYGFSIARSSANQNSVYQIISILNSPQYLSSLSQTMYLPPVRRDLIASGSSDPYISIFDEQALIAKTWLDADPSQSFQIFGNMVNAVTSGAKSSQNALYDASDQYDVVLRQAVQ